MRATSERTLCACRCMRFNLRMVDPRHVAVIPATALTHPCASRNSHFLCSKAGIPSVVFFDRAPFGRSSSTNKSLWVVDPSLRASCALAKFVHPCTARQVTFFCVAKRKSPKKRPPPSRRRATSARCPALLRKIGRETNSPADERHIRSGSNNVSRTPPIFLPMLGLL